MDDLKIIEEREVLGRDFKIYGDFENPIFLAKDIADWIGNKNVTEMVSKIDEDEVTRFNLGGKQGICNFLTEDGLYEVLMQSRKPIAKAFKTEVKKILKQIRKTGGYIPIKEEDTEDVIMAKALMIGQKTIEKQKILLAQKDEELKEKDRFLGQISASSTTMLVRDIAHLATKKGFAIGEKRLWNKLRTWGMVSQVGTKPTQRFLEQGIFEVSEFAISTNHGIQTKNTTRVTGKGQIYIINKLLKETI